MIRMRTINRKPVKAYRSLAEDRNNRFTIDWVCHGIDQHGNRQKWTERTHTVFIWVETYDKAIFKRHYDYRTTRFIYPPGKFERQSRED